jgi:hypothetical protein
VPGELRQRRSGDLGVQGKIAGGIDVSDQQVDVAAIAARGQGQELVEVGDAEGSGAESQQCAAAQRRSAHPARSVRLDQQHRGSGAEGDQQVALRRRCALAGQEHAGPRSPGFELGDRSGVQSQQAPESRGPCPGQTERIGLPGLNFACRLLDGVGGNDPKAELPGGLTDRQLGQGGAGVHSDAEVFPG